MNQRIKSVVEFAERAGLGGNIFASYQEAVDLARTSEWWRNVAMHLFETFRDELAEYDARPSMLLADEVESAEHMEHEDRCGDS